MPKISRIEPIFAFCFSLEIKVQIHNSRIMAIFKHFLITSLKLFDSSSNKPGAVVCMHKAQNVLETLKGKILRISVPQKSFGLQRTLS